MDDIKKFTETQLPEKESFFSKLTRSGVSDKEYEYAQKVWKETNCKDLGQWHDMYLLSDVLLLADVFETYRKTMKTHKLDPSRYITLPSFSFDACLFSTSSHL